jgi:hypothetical protein
MGPTALIPHPEEVLLRIFVALAEFEPANLGSNGKHGNN